MNFLNNRKFICMYSAIHALKQESLFINQLVSLMELNCIDQEWDLLKIKIICLVRMTIMVGSSFTPQHAASFLFH